MRSKYLLYYVVIVRASALTSRLTKAKDPHGIPAEHSTFSPHTCCISGPRIPFKPSAHSSCEADNERSPNPRF
ncbi:hypothetical protein CYMTET_13319 [Cymbomonas tetramitiformis]|uniref:Uncharacterized protein n=1 Tax=Cymbomonas tetramitiformis TaxID=36881 RepID=A0AAE0GIX1_9CHLO|nr:hypothetical protein CYMTET_13319 [Cymbomonas tetramitiformis]